MKPYVRRGWLCVTIVFIICFRYLTVLTNPWNWVTIAGSRQDVPAILLLLVAGGAVLVLLSRLFDRLVPPGLQRDRLILLSLFILIWPALDSWIHIPSFRKADALIKILFVLSFGWGILKNAARTKSVLVAALFIFSPTIPIYLVHALGFYSPPLSSGVMPASPPPRGDAPPPVVFLLFDEWSYIRTFTDGQPLTGLNGLSTMASQSQVFHRAFTPGEVTETSIPVLLGTTRWGAPKDKPFSQLMLLNLDNHIFEAAKKEDWRTMVLGSYMPYVLWAGASADFCRWIPGYRMPESGLISDVATHANLVLLNFFSYWKMPFATTVSTWHDTIMQKRRAAYVRREAAALLTKTGPGTFLYIHYPVPHDPYINVDKKALEGLSEADREVKKYEGNIRLADETLMEAIQILKQNGQWDNSLVIVTSDHAWKKDPIYQNMANETASMLKKHVPLLIKLPDQMRRIDESTPVRLEEVTAALRRVFPGDFSRQRVAYGSHGFQLEDRR